MVAKVDPNSRNSPGNFDMCCCVSCGYRWVFDSWETHIRVQIKSLGTNQSSCSWMTGSSCQNAIQRSTCKISRADMEVAQFRFITRNVTKICTCTPLPPQIWTLWGSAVKVSCSSQQCKYAIRAVLQKPKLTTLYIIHTQLHEMSHECRQNLL